MVELSLRVWLHGIRLPCEMPRVLRQPRLRMGKVRVMSFTMGLTVGASEMVRHLNGESDCGRHRGGGYGEVLEATQAIRTVSRPRSLRKACLVWHPELKVWMQTSPVNISPDFQSWRKPGR